MKSEMSRKSDMFHPYTLVIHPDFKELGDFILSLPEKKTKLSLFIKDVMN